MKITNEVLSEYVSLIDEVRDKNRRIEEIKEGIKERGSFATDEFVCMVDIREQIRLPGLDEVKKVITLDTLLVLGLIRRSEVKTVRVTRREPQYSTLPVGRRMDETESNSRE